MGIIRSFSISLASCAFFGLAGCKADVDWISTKILAGFDRAELMSSEARFTCHRATYVVEVTDVTVLSTFSKLDSLYSSSFLDSVTGVERDFWGQAVLDENVLWRVDRSTEEWHYWFDTVNKRLLVMQLDV